MRHISGENRTSKLNIYVIIQYKDEAWAQNDEQQKKLNSEATERWEQQQNNRTRTAMQASEISYTYNDITNV